MVLTYHEAPSLSGAELEVREFCALELLRQGVAERAAKTFVELTHLDRFEKRYYRGANLAFAHSRNWSVALDA